MLKNMPDKYRRALAKCRYVVAPLRVETSRYKQNKNKNKNTPLPPNKKQIKQYNTTQHNTTQLLNIDVHNVVSMIESMKTFYFVS